MRGECLLWWTEGNHLPPLVTTSLVGTSSDMAGVLGQPGTSILFGDSTANVCARSGERITLGYWFDPTCHLVGVQASYLGLGRETTHFSAANTNTPIIARPYYDTQLGAQAAMLVAYPNLLSGSIDVDLATDFQAIEVLFRRALFQRCCDKLDFLVGWGYAQLDERLSISQSSLWTAEQGPIIPGTTKTLFDLFDTESQFHGAELGLVYQGHVGSWSLEALLKIGLGNTHSRVYINGSTTTTVPDVEPYTYLGGLLAQRTNMGRYEWNDFAIIPEVGVTLGYDITCQLRATLGYTFLYWSRVARPARQIDTSVSQLPPEDPTGDQRPAFAFSPGDFWAQGLNFGFEYRY